MRKIQESGHYIHYGMRWFENVLIQNGTLGGLGHSLLLEHAVILLLGW